VQGAPFTHQRLSIIRKNATKGIVVWEISTSQTKQTKKTNNLYLERWVNKKKRHYLENRNYIFGSLQSFNILFVMGQSKWLVAKKRKRKRKK
jgi:DNA-dependent RNA polymerase auxiliary subunit epsilon